MHQHTNKLAQANSPYLLQHAHNPVNWFPWGEEAQELARAQDKLMIVSIGYSSCHWCHVMERESFEDSAAAAVMNKHFVSIKVDREEHPEVDEVYMAALQLMSGQGGWPLNVICLPDGRPIWGATYVPRSRWIEVLHEINKLYQNEQPKVEEYAQKLTQGIRQNFKMPVVEIRSEFGTSEAKLIFENWWPQLDTVEGGANRAPKFPMPGNQRFIMHYAHLSGDERALDYLSTTLQKMAFGGIYDQVGGGFARYSTDSFWKVPHFEKMLYDNAQLIQLYSEAYQRDPQPLYALTVRQSIAWIEREMSDPSGAVYSALDADSEGEEGKFYLWTSDELQKLIPAQDYPLFADYYNINKKGHWEHGRYILLRDQAEAHFCESYTLEPEALRNKISQWKKILLQARAGRERPALDDKALTSWNAMMLSAYLSAFQALGEPAYRASAQKIAQWICNTQSSQDGHLRHAWRQGKSYLPGILEDYAFAAQAFLDFYALSGETAHLEQAQRWVTIAKEEFEDSASGLFYTRSLSEKQLIAKNLETADNVTPSANSVMAHNLFRLGHYLEAEDYHRQAHKMLSQVAESALQYGESYSNWGRLILQQSYPFYEVAIAGPQAATLRAQFHRHYLPQVLFIFGESESELPLLVQRYQKDQTRIFVCQNRSCQRPVKEVQAALQQMNN